MSSPVRYANNTPLKFARAVGNGVHSAVGILTFVKMMLEWVVATSLSYKSPNWREPKKKHTLLLSHLDC